MTFAAGGAKAGHLYPDYAERGERVKRGATTYATDGPMSSGST